MDLRANLQLRVNPQLELACDYVRATSTSIFLTGKAGSGKTTFLHQIKAEGVKRLAVVAPTGVAAINAGGMTIHSFFQLPFGLHVPDGRRKNDDHHLSRKKLNLIRSLELLVIDEISMVRADLLDAIDQVLRRCRGDSRPFGGVQLLMIGDLHQLPPVVKPEDWDTLRRYYKTPYFFGSLALSKTNYVSIELKHIYRQTDAEFIGLLNKVRDNRLDEETLRTLNSRHIPNFRPPLGEAFITLTATNAVALDINTRNLKQLPGKSKFFSAQIQGQFPESSYPTEEKLEFKLGAQVMFIKNDLQPEKRYFNGKIGRIVKIDEEAIYVRCDNDAIDRRSLPASRSLPAGSDQMHDNHETDIEVTPAEWKNVKYSLNETTKEIEEQVLGTFTQYPLKLAWAITIHKSQGLTFERAIIDAQAAFAHGQVYVALSRCKSFEGIVLHSRIDFSSVKTDPVVKEFCAEAERNAPTDEQIQQAKRQYQQQLVRDLFSFQDIQRNFSQLRHVYQEHQHSLTIEASNQVAALARQAHETLAAIADKFQPQLEDYLQSEGLPTANQTLQERIAKAAIYFTDKFAGLLHEVNSIPTACDNQAVRSSAVAQLDKLRLNLFVKQATFAACKQGFSTTGLQRSQVDAELDWSQRGVAKSANELKVPKGLPNAELYGQLLQYRLQMAEQLGIVPREVLTNESLRQLVMQLPTTRGNIRLIHGIGSKRLQRYGTDIGKIVRKYCEEKQVPSDQMYAQTSPTQTKGGLLVPRKVPDTKLCSFQMLQAGKTIEQIASERKLALSTIQSHLAHFIALRQLDISQFLAQEKLAEIEQYHQANPDAKLSEAKAHFGNKFDYGELNLAFSHLRQVQDLDSSS